MHACLIISWCAIGGTAHIGPHLSRKHMYYTTIVFIAKTLDAVCGQLIVPPTKTTNENRAASAANERPKFITHKRKEKKNITDRYRECGRGASLGYLSLSPCRSGSSCCHKTRNLHTTKHTQPKPRTTDNGDHVI